LFGKFYKLRWRFVLLDHALVPYSPY